MGNRARTKQAGFSTIVMMLVLFVCSALAVSALQSTSVALGKTGMVYRASEEKRQAEEEIRLILSTPSLCKRLMTVTGSRFSLGRSTSMAFRKSFSVDHLTMEHMNRRPDGSTKADFTVSGHIDSGGATQTLKASVAGYVWLSGSTVTDCKIEMDQASACAAAGLTWYASQNRCGICEAEGGVWTTGHCQLM